jgi:AcrR family transcriptional regulator
MIRADAARNRAKVLSAAESVFAELGTTASTEEVARRAGVGIGTVFRHFPTKESLLEAVLDGLLRRLADESEALAEADDPGAAFYAFFTRIVTQATTKNALTEALDSLGVDRAQAVHSTGTRLRSSLGTLLARAQDAGVVRGDLDLPELMDLLSVASRVTTAQSKVLEVVFDGLRPGRPPATGR